MRAHFSIFAIQISGPDYDIVMHNSMHTKIVHDSCRVIVLFTLQLTRAIFSGAHAKLIENRSGGCSILTLTAHRTITLRFDFSIWFCFQSQTRRKI